MYKEVKIEQDTSNAKSFRKGIITNFLNPYPYLFWLTVGAPILYSAYYNNILSIVLFLTGLYFSLVGSKIVIVFIVDRSKSLLKNTTYIYSVRILGLIILLFAFIFTKEGLLLLGLHF
jgi:threonine/homoserine/homoserine lactone efflux protein